MFGNGTETEKQFEKSETYLYDNTFYGGDDRKTKEPVPERKLQFNKNKNRDVFDRDWNRNKKICSGTGTF